MQHFEVDQEICIHRSLRGEGALGDRFLIRQIRLKTQSTLLTPYHGAITKHKGFYLGSVPKPGDAGITSDRISD